MGHFVTLVLLGLLLLLLTTDIMDITDVKLMGVGVIMVELNVIYINLAWLSAWTI